MTLTTSETQENVSSPQREFRIPYMDIDISDIPSTSTPQRVFKSVPSKIHKRSLSDSERLRRMQAVQYMLRQYEVRHTDNVLPDFLLGFH